LKNKTTVMRKTTTMMSCFSMYLPLNDNVYSAEKITNSKHNIIVVMTICLNLSSSLFTYLYYIHICWLIKINVLWWFLTLFGP